MSADAAHGDRNAEDRFVGMFWVGPNWQIYLCESYEPRLGYWMRNAAVPADRRNISERAPYRTFHPLTGQWPRKELDLEGEFYGVDLSAAEPTVRQVSGREIAEAGDCVAFFCEQQPAKAAVGRAMKASSERASGTCY